MKSVIFEQFRFFTDSDWFTRMGLNYPGVLVFVLIWIFALGACLGSFMNVCIWRIPRGESVSLEPSHCGKCNALIKWYDNIPVVSYLVLRGRCRSCLMPYSPRYLMVEIICGLLFAGAVVKTGLLHQPLEILVNYAIAILYAVAVAWIDAEYRIIPDKLTFPVAVIGLLTSLAFPGIYGTESRLESGIAALLAGALPALYLAIFALVGKWIAKREVLGWGDVKFIFACGVLIGLPGALFTILAGALAGALYGMIFALCSKRKMSKTAIAFGPFLAGAMLVWIFAGQLFAGVLALFRGA